MTNCHGDIEDSCSRTSKAFPLINIDAFGTRRSFELDVRRTNETAVVIIESKPDLSLINKKSPAHVWHTVVHLNLCVRRTQPTIPGGFSPAPATVEEHSTQYVSLLPGPRTVKFRDCDNDKPVVALVDDWRVRLGASNGAHVLVATCVWRMRDLTMVSAGTHKLGDRTHDGTHPLGWCRKLSALRFKHAYRNPWNARI